MDEQNQIDRMFLDYIDENRNRLVEHVRQTARIDNVEREARDGAPFGPGIKKTLDLTLSISRNMGFKTVDLDGYIGYAFYGRGEDYVYAMGHVDVVPAGEGRKESPFKGHMENGVIYSRGVLDNKGPVMACLYGLAAVRALGLPLRHPVRIIFGCNEGTGFEGLRYYLLKEKPSVYEFTPDCKYPVVHSERGRAVVRITSTRECLGTFFDLMNKYFIRVGNTDDRLGVNYYHEEYGMMGMRGYRLGLDPVWKTGQGNIRRVNAGNKNAEVSAGNGNAVNTVYFEVTSSYPGGITIREIMKPITEKAESCGLKAELVQNCDPVVFAKDTPMAKAMQDSYERVTGMNGTPITTTGGTYAKTMSGIVPFGPSFPGQKGTSHNPNEWMTVDDLVTNAKIYVLTLYRLAQL